jgi:predicted amidohydrolase
MKVAVAQMAPVLGDMAANLEKIRLFQCQAKAEGAELVVFPELALSGYAVGQEVYRYALKASDDGFRTLLELSRDLPMIVGFVERSARGRIYNAAALIDGGKVVHLHRKVYLPSYGPWEEGKIFARGKRLGVFHYRGFRMAIFVCYDFWFPSMIYLAACDDADVFVVIANSSLDSSGMNPRAWDHLVRSPALLYGGYVVFCNRVGVEHGWSFWGGSTVIGPAGGSNVAAGMGEEIIFQTLEPKAVERARDALPLLRDLDVDFTLRELQEVTSRRISEND